MADALPRHIAAAAGAGQDRAIDSGGVMEQGLTFDKVADTYDTVRPGYPDSLFDDVVVGAGLVPGDAVLEVGCGTGKATVPLARRGLHITALDPGPALLRVAGQMLEAFANVELVESGFETWPPPPRLFKLIVAAQSWHWVAPEVRFVKAADLLTPDGTLAVFGNVPVGLEPPGLLEAFERVYRHHTGLWGSPPEAWYLPSGPVAQLFDESRRFQPVIHKNHPWTWSHTAATYSAFVRTRSDTQVVAPDPERREALVAAIGDAITAHGGRLDVRYEAHLYMARRKA